MPKCRKCHNDIDFLNLTIRKFYKHTSYYNKEKRRIEMKPCKLTYTKVTYRCPSCYSYLFYSTKQAEKFLKKGQRRADIKTSW